MPRPLSLPTTISRAHRTQIIDLLQLLQPADRQLWQETRIPPFLEFIPLPAGFRQALLRLVSLLSGDEVLALCQTADDQCEPSAVGAYVRSAERVLHLGLLLPQTLSSRLRAQAATALLILLANHRAELLKPVVLN